VWELVIQMEGDQPPETEVEDLEEQVCNLLDDASFEYLDVTSR